MKFKNRLAYRDGDKVHSGTVTTYKTLLTFMTDNKVIFLVIY